MYDAYWSAKGATPGRSATGAVGAILSSGVQWGAMGAFAGFAIGGGPFGALVGGAIGTVGGLLGGALSYFWDDINKGLFGDSRLISGFDFRRPVVNTRLAATMRQAAMQSILSSGSNYRQYLGKEAAQLHA